MARALALLAFLLLSALVFAGRSQAEVESPPPPQVWSDKADYSPGELVTLTGANWAPGESVHIRVNDDAGETWSRDVDVVADANGAFTDQFTLPDWFVAVYNVTATGATSGTATWSFTDGNVRFDIAPTTARATFVENIYTAATDCTGAVRTNGGFPDKTLTNSNGDNVGVGNSESLRVDASATTTNSPTLSFLAWSTTDSSPFTVIAGTNGLSACFPGFQGNGTRNYRATYQNAAPTIASDNATVTVNEGATASNSGTWSDDNPAETVTLTASVGTVTKAGSNAGGTWSWSFGTNDGPAQSQTVTITATDSRGLTAITTFALVVNNVAPTATFPATRTVSEGSASTFSFSGESDPSGPDTAAGFHYAYSCTNGSLAGATYAGSGTSASVTCPASAFDDGPGSQTVRARIIDKDGGFTEYTTAVTITNVAPTATFANDGPVDEGTSFHLSLNGASDPSSADTAAGLEYAFDCGGGAGYGAFGSSNTATCPTSDNATRTVKGKVRDKDGGVSEYTASVTVRNVAPTVSVANDGPIDEGGSATITVTATDPAGAADPLMYEFDCDNNGFYEAGPQASNTHVCSFADDGSYSVIVNVSDGDGGNTAALTIVTVNNVAPFVTAAADQTSNEGSSHSFDLGSFTDPGDDGPWSVSVDWGDGSPLEGFSAAGPGSLGSASHTYADGPEDHTVTVTVTEAGSGSQPSGSDTFAVHVQNVAPSATFTNDGPVDEGSSFHLSLDGASDPSAADTAAGFEYAFDCGDGSGYGAFGGSNTASCSTTDDGDRSVGGKVRDKDGGVSEYTATVTVENVAPTIVSVTNDGPIDEGSSATITVTATDPAGAADPLTYQFDCDNDSVYEVGPQAGNTHACSFNDNGSYPVNVLVFDDDGGGAGDFTIVTVDNVAPTATFDDDGPVDEGSSFHLSLTDPFDPSAADTAAGFEYAFDCGDGAGYGAWSGDASATCSTDDNGSRSVGGKIRDKDGGVSEYTATVTVNNVAPTAIFSNNAPVNEGSSFTLTLDNADDVSSVDKTFGFYFRFDCGDGSGYGPWSSTAEASGSRACPTNDDGTRSVKGEIKDKDGGVTEYTGSVTVNNVAPTVSISGPTPVNENKNGSETYHFSVFDPGNDGFTVVSGYPDCGTGGSLQGGVTLDGDGHGGSFNCRFSDGPADPTLTMQVRDADEPAGSSSADSNVAEYDVHVNNVAPTVNLSGADEADEGSSEWYTFTLSDPGTDTFSFPAGYPTCGSHGELLGTPAVGDGQFQCFFSDGPNTTDVAVKVQDDDGGVSTPDVEQVDIITVTVANVAPVVTAAAGQSSDEGENHSFDLGSFTDPGDDGPWAVEVDWGDGSAHTTFPMDSPGPLPAKSHTYPDGPDDHIVTVTVSEADSGPSGFDTFDVHVYNVAPSVQFTLAPTTADEGDTKTYEYTYSDPGDDAISFAAGYPSCGDDGNLVGSPSISSGSFQCSFPEGPNTTNVAIRVSDSDGASSTDVETVNIVEVTIANVAPTATFSNDGPVDEGSPVTVSFSDQFDPSAADTAAGFHYVYSCNGSPLNSALYTDGGTSASHTCTFGDNGDYDVTGRIIDRNDGGTTYTTTVRVRNVAPTASNGSFTIDSVFGTATAGFDFSDVGWLDTHGPNLSFFTWSDVGNRFATVTEENGAPNATGHASDTRTFVPGCYNLTVTGTAKDDDGATSAPLAIYSNSAAVFGRGFRPPIMDNERNIAKYGNVVPVKVVLTNTCTGATVTNVPLFITIAKGVGDEAIEDTNLIAESVSSADTGSQMRTADGMYIYNLSTKSLQANNNYTIRIRPYSTTTPYILQAVLYPKK